MAQLIFDFMNSQYLGIFLLIWIVVDLIWVQRWKALIERMSILLQKSWIFKADDNPRDTPLYPREFLEQLALGNRRGGGASTSVDPFTKWINNVGQIVFDSYNPLRPLFSLIFLVFFILFIVSDTIIISNTLVLLSLIGELSLFMQRLDIAILGGTVVSAVIGIWVLVEVSGKGEFTNTDALSDQQRTLFRALSITVVLLSIVVMIALSIQRLMLLGVLQGSATTDLILSFVLYGVLTINITLSTTLVYRSAASGLVVVIYLLIILITVLLPVLVFLVDVLWRMTYIAVDILLWVIATPVIAIPYGFGRIFGWIR